MNKNPAPHRAGFLFPFDRVKLQSVGGFALSPLIVSLNELGLYWLLIPHFPFLLSTIIIEAGDLQPFNPL